MIFSPEKYLAEWTAAHRRYEVFAFSKFKAGLNAQVTPVINHIKTYGGITAPLINMLIEKQPIESAYRQVYISIGTLHAKWTYNRINAMGRKQGAMVTFEKSISSLISDGWHRLMQSFFTHEAATRVSDVTETTRERVRKVLTDSEALPVSERATYMVDTLDSPDFNRNRALTIARTESTAAANKGASIGNEDADYETNKRWLAVMDRNTRPDHVEANGQIVGNNDMFVVGSSLCLYPGDLTLPAAECINCRCCVAYVPVFRNGLPVMK